MFSGGVKKRPVALNRFIIIWYAGQWDPHNEVGFLTLAKYNLEFEQATCCFSWNPLAHWTTPPIKTLQKLSSFFWNFLVLKICENQIISRYTD